MDPFVSKRFKKTISFPVAAPREVVFPLLCPVREHDWLAHWQCRVLYSESGFVEDGCVFTTDFEGDGPAVWYVNRHDAKDWVFEVIITHPSILVRKLKVTLDDAPEGTLVHWSEEYTALGWAGNEMISKRLPEMIDGKIAHLAKVLDHYCRTGECSRSAVS